MPPGCGQLCGAVPVNIPISFWSWVVYIAGGGRFSVGLSLFLSVEMLLHRSGHIPEIAVLYTHVPNTGRGEFTPRESVSKPNGASKLWTSWTPVELGLTRMISFTEVYIHIHPHSHACINLAYSSLGLLACSNFSLHCKFTGGRFDWFMECFTSANNISDLSVCLYCFSVCIVVYLSIWKPLCIFTCL